MSKGLPGNNTEKNGKKGSGNLLSERRFLPLSLCVEGKKVIVFGGSKRVLKEVVRLLENGACVTCVGAVVDSEIQDLCIVYGERMKLVRKNTGAYLEQLSADSTFDLILSMSTLADSELIAAHFSGQSVFMLHNPSRSTVDLPTSLRRGHLKISVSTDGLCQPLEEAILARLEEILLADLDRYSLFLGALREKLETLRDAGEVATLMQTMENTEQFGSALSRQSFDEALRLLEIKGEK